MMDKKTELIMMLLKIRGVGGKTVRKIMKNITSVDKAVDNYHFLNELDISVVKKHITSGQLTAKIWEQYRQTVLTEFTQAQKLDIEIVNYLEPTFPQRLLKLKRFPVILYLKGDISLLNSTQMVTIVGTRTPTTEGIQREVAITKWFSEQGYVIVSGLAQGCDTYAHQTAKFTIAVLAQGLDLPIYPRQNREIAVELLVDRGLLVSTYQLGTKTLPQYLAARDEWQSGLGDGVIVAETGLTGGTHTTVNFALEQVKPLAVLKYQRYCQSNLGNEKLLVNHQVDALTTTDTWLNFVKRMKRGML